MSSVVVFSVDTSSIATTVLESCKWKAHSSSREYAVGVTTTEPQLAASSEQVAKIGHSLVL